MNISVQLKKSAAFVLLFLFLATLSEAQNYSVMNSGSSAFFRSEIQTSLIPFGSYNGYFTWSRIKESFIDSIASSANETNYFTFHTWRDTAVTNPGIDCGELYGPSWMGNQIIERNNGTSLLFNEAGDSILIERDASLGQTWTFYRYQNNAEIRALVNSISWVNYATFSDSVKEIQLQAYDSLGQPDLNHPASNFILLLSKSHGFIRYFSVREFPQLILPLIQIEAIPRVQIQDIYNYSIGDEFEYTGSCTTITGPNQPPGYSYVRIDDKWLNPGQDSIYYKRFVINLTLQMNWNPVPHLDSIVSIAVDTILLPYTQTPFYTTVPEEYGMLLHNSYFNIRNCYTMDQDTALYNNRIVYTETDGYFDMPTGDSCIMFNHFEPLLYQWNYSTGLGLVSSQFNNMSTTGTACETDLIWFHKGSETWGTFVQLTTGTAEIETLPSFDFYPSPALNFVTVVFQNQLPEQILLFSNEGKCLKSILVNEQKIQIDLSEFPSGIYTLSAQGIGFTGKKKLVHFSAN